MSRFESGAQCPRRLRPAFPIVAAALRRVSVNVLAATVVLAPSARAAALVWEKETIVADAEPSAKRFKTEFHFRNASDHSVTLTNIEPGCRCMTADVTKRTYAPGETGVLPVVFTFGDQVGLQEKAVFIETDEPNTQPLHVTLRVNIAELATLEPLGAVWRIGEEANEKSILCTAAPGKFVTIVDLQPADSGFSARFEAIENGKAYRVYVRPRETKTSRSATLSIKTIVADAGERTYEAVFAVK